MKRLVMLALISCGGGSKSEPRVVAPPPVVEAPPPEPVKPAPPKDLAPDTPAGKLLRAWLDTFNSADEARMQAFAAKYKSPPQTMDLGFRKNTGGFDLVSIVKSEPLAVTFVLKEKAGPTTAVGWMKVTDGDPATLTTFELEAIPPGMTAADMNITIDAATRTRVIDAAVAKLTEYYVYPAVAKKMVAALREHQKQGDYDAIVDATAFAPLLTEHLRAVSHDRHLRVEFSAMKVPEGDPEPSDAEKARFHERLEKMNCGFQKAERLDGNIGYIKFDMFAEVDFCGAKATAAFAAIGAVDALIFDLRENGGGQPDMVAFISSYLFDKRTHLNDLYDRKQNKTTQYWTKPGVPGTKFPKQPVFVLTSKRTFSGAEEFSYNLKNLKRATIVGETTGGGAHPTTGKRLDDHFVLGVPFARAINPITKTNWEGKGVEPDVQVPADQALDTAKKLAAEQVAKNAKK
ncbi:MAG: S41 family peptidase [Kofleriaceae bacterium]